jgi:putative FmdB family regulatory protein
MLCPAHRAVCRRGDDFCNPRMQVYGCRERHGLPPLIVDLIRTYKSQRLACSLCAFDGHEGVACGAQTGQQNSFDKFLRLRFREQCADGRRAMPHYEYLCPACSKKFSIVLTLAEHEKGQVKCPKCGSTKVEQQWAAFYATTSKKS